MKVTRRGFLRFGLGGAVTMLTAAAAPLLRATEAYAIAGVDDAVLGAMVLVMMTLSGYAVSEALTSTTMSAMGYDFSRFAQDASNQSAAVTRAIADANNLGVQVNRQNAEDAAAAIAAGTGAAGAWLSDAAESGRIALDGWLSGIGENQAALWGLVAEFQQNYLGLLPTASSTAEWAGNSGTTVGDVGLNVRISGISDILGAFPLVSSYSVTPTWAVMQSEPRYVSGIGSIQYLFYGGGTSPAYFYRNNSGVILQRGSSYIYWVQYNHTRGNYTTREYTSYTWSSTDGVPVVSADMVVGPTLPGVDRVADAPETYGAGYVKTILGSDLVIDPATGDVVSAGTIALPVEYPYVQLPYVDGLYQQGAGVVAGLHDMPLSGQTSAVVGTGEGVVSMPISQAISTDTSLAEQAEPVVPPGTPDVGPWVPAYDLPFYEVWPFNMVYSFVSALSELGGA